MPIEIVWTEYPEAVYENEPFQIKYCVWNNTPSEQILYGYILKEGELVEGSKWVRSVPPGLAYVSVTDIPEGIPGATHFAIIAGHLELKPISLVPYMLMALFISMGTLNIIRTKYKLRR